VNDQPDVRKLTRVEKRRIAKAIKKMAHLYQELPTVACKGLCVESCGPIQCSSLERIIMPPLPEPKGMRCPFLSDEGRCVSHVSRPLLCRLFGAIDHPLMTCVHDCEVTPRKLTHAEGQEKLRQIRRVATECGLGEMVALHPAAWPLTEEQADKIIANAKAEAEAQTKPESRIILP